MKVTQLTKASLNI